jgi:hypothetical protein
MSQSFGGVGPSFWERWGGSMVIAALVGILLMVTQCARADEHYGNFVTTQPVEEFVFDAALAADMLTTADIKNHPNLIETNPILGQHPSDAKIAMYGASAALLHAAVTYELVSQDVPKPVIRVWEYLSIGVEVGYVTHNYKIGLKMRF